MAQNGALSLRRGVSAVHPVEPKSIPEINRHAKVVYEWIKRPKSYIRIIHSWQAAGGLSFVANVCHISMQCFFEYGESKHSTSSGSSVSLEEVQRCIVHRHESVGMEEADASAANVEL